MTPVRCHALYFTKISDIGCSQSAAGRALALWSYESAAAGFCSTV